MGIIKRQTISGTIFTYLGVVIGFITTALIFPKILSKEQIGLLSIFLSYSYIFAQLGTLGTGRITIVFFPFFRDRAKSHHGFFNMIAIISIIGLVMVTLAYFILRPWLVENANDTSTLLAENVNYLLPLIISTWAFLVFDSYYKNLLNAIQGIILKEFVQRAFILIFIIFYVYKWITFQQYIPLYVLAIAIPPFILFFNLLRHKEFTLRPYSVEKINEYRQRMISVGIYGIIIGFSGMVILNIDRIMVERMLGLGSTGIYSTMAYFATLIVIPSRALMKISDPIIAKAWKDGDMNNIRNNYYRSSINQFIAGTLLLAGIWGNIGNIERILPPAFAAGSWVIFFIGLAFLTDMATGTATYILANSKYFKYQTYFVLLLVFFIVISNYLLIPVWGITGAAIATFISKFLNNLMRHQLLYMKFRLQPYNWKYVWIILIAVIAYYGGYFLPDIKNLYLDIAIRSSIIGGIFILLLVILKISPEVNEKVDWILGRIRR